MLNDSQSNQTDNSRGLLSGLVRFLSDILKDVSASLLVVTLTFLFATAVTAGMLWYYEWPLFLSPVGGFIVLGVMLLFWYDS
jgi:ABC-type bacteriocin/lantibiotic exporter with double-glycine peptidase domain